MRTVSEVISELRERYDDGDRQLADLMPEVLQIFDGIAPDRLSEILDAEKRGDLRIMPGWDVFGEPVYRIVKDAHPHITRDEVMGIYEPRIALIGRTLTLKQFRERCFFTRAAAENALKGDAEK